MGGKVQKFDKTFVIIAGLLVFFGFFAFLSASLSVLVESRSLFSRTLLSQLLLGLVGGGIAGYIGYRIPIHFWKKYALGFLIAGFVITGLIFVPGLALEHGGARRWIDLGFVSFQPAEFLKIGVVIYLSAWFAFVKEKVVEVKFGLLAVVIILGASGAILLAQPDTGTFLVIIASTMALYFVSGAPWKHIGFVILCAIVFGGLLIAVRPYVLDRVKTYINPSHDPLGSSYQIRQSMISLGSGGLTGRGYGRSIQKYSYLPEPTGDSIFAVIGEELGFIGSVALIVLYGAFLMRGFRIARHTKDVFGRLLVTGLVILIVAQSFLNIGSSINILPLTGLPLIFVSKGGTALMLALFSVGVIVAVSETPRRAIE